jgi:hypothetical protein
MIKKGIGNDFNSLVNKLKKGAGGMAQEQEGDFLAFLRKMNTGAG